MRATWNGAVIAESPNTVIVEGNHYFPLGSLTEEHLEPSDHTTYRPWKGTAGYFHVEVDGKRNANAAWIYREPKDEASHLRDHVAFWKGVAVTG